MLGKHGRRYGEYLYLGVSATGRASLSDSVLTFQQTCPGHEISSSAGKMDDMGDSIDFDVSTCFDDFSGTVAFLSDVDVRALLSSSFLS